MPHSDDLFEKYLRCFLIFHLRRVRRKLHFGGSRNFTAQQLHSPEANLVVESSCQTNDTLDVAQDSKRSQNSRKMGVETPKGLIFRSERALVIESVLYPTRHLRIWNFFHTHQRIRLRFIFTKTVFVAVISPSVHRHI